MPECLLNKSCVNHQVLAYARLSTNDMKRTLVPRVRLEGNPETFSN